jgi:hypothetical protein
MTLKRIPKSVLILFLLTGAVLVIGAGAKPRSVAVQQPEVNVGKSLKAWEAIHSVLTHPRCLNCHIPGDGPLQGDEQRTHDMNVKRGIDGKGTPAMRCSNCHGDTNATTLHAPPGAADWSLPKPRTPMAWKGLSTGEICRALKDPSKNGNRSLQDLVPHMETSLVKWAWSPGPGRTVPPLTRDEFVSQLKQWIDSGAACPN